MKIAIIKAPWWVRYCPPYILSFLGTLIRKKGHISLFDFNNSWYHKVPEKYKKYWDDRDYYSFWEQKEFIEEIAEEINIDKYVKNILDEDPTLILFETHTPNVLISYEIAKRLKNNRKDIVIVFMGHKASRAQMAYDFVRQSFIDYVCPGEIDIVLFDLIKALGKRKKQLPKIAGLLSKDENNGIFDGGNPSIVENLDSLPFPEYDDFKYDIEKGYYSMPNRFDILDSRGCINACHFCYERLFWQKYRTMSGRKLFEQANYHMRKFPQINYFYFNGLLLNGSPKTIEEFCDLVIKNSVKIQWAGQASVRGMSKELIFKMKEAGCQWLGYGIESGSQKVLNEMNKNININEAVDVLKYTHEAGIKAQINIMFGFPTETENDFKETLKFLIKVRPYIDSVLASQSFCTLEKETYMWKYPKKFGINAGSHHLFWSSQNGINNYLERFKRYERFCKIALKLGLPETSGVLRERPDKKLLLKQYYEYRKLQESSKNQKKG